MVYGLKDAIDARRATVGVVGLGYVGEPLANAFARDLEVIGYDHDSDRVRELSSTARLSLTTDPAPLEKADFVLLCLPTPLTDSHDPDLSAVEDAARSVGRHLSPDTVVVLESTVPPGTTRDLVVPCIQEGSGLSRDRFAVGYSPERMNPGDDDHTIDAVTKVVAGEDRDTTETLEYLYGLITDVHVAADIETAETAKLLENVQRDLNIALVNELAMMLSGTDVDTQDVLETARTKWNFHDYHPGLVGGHCLPVDPYFLSSAAERLGTTYTPSLLTSGRQINDAVAEHVAGMTVDALDEKGKTPAESEVLVLGRSYKADVDEERNSQIPRLIRQLQRRGVQVSCHDPLVAVPDVEDPACRIRADIDTAAADALIVATPHEVYRRRGVAGLKTAAGEDPVIVDVEGVFDADAAREHGFTYYRL